MLIGPDGEDLAAYRKIHLFDVDAGGVSLPTVRDTSGPSEIITAPLGDLIVGLAVCYDLRFPELFRILALRGARLFAIPSAFTLATGRDHWEVLLRARAIENQAFVLAPNQVGKAPPHFDSFGRSAIVDPWGMVLASAPDGVLPRPRPRPGGAGARPRVAAVPGQSATPAHTPGPSDGGRA